MMVLALTVGLHRLRDPSFRCAPLRMTGVIGRVEEKEKGAAQPPLFLFPPQQHRPCPPERSEGTRGHTSAAIPRDYIPNHLHHHKNRKQPNIFSGKTGEFVRDAIPVSTSDLHTPFSVLRSPFSLLSHFLIFLITQ